MRKVLLLLYVLSCLPNLFAQEGGLARGAAATAPAASDPYRVRTSIDWQRRVLVLEVALDLKGAGLRLPEGRLVAERMVGRDLPGLAKEPFFSIPVDSSRNVGDTIIDKKRPAAEGLPGYKVVQPMVFTGLFPTEGDKFEELRDALEKLKLNDAALMYDPESSNALGFGFRCGFLGLLHMDIVREAWSASTTSSCSPRCPTWSTTPISPTAT